MKPLSDQATKLFINGMVCVLVGILIGLYLSKFSARAAYNLGHSVATQNLQEQADIRWEHFEKNRMESCLAWWFNDSFKNLKAAQFYMCQNRRKWE
jgi:uncharacterized membrane protein YraQ (UPF0718 family)